jgi:antitoxin (DNA-binding transcriptional repressor) of toxin-antitoxin stability system
MPKQIGVKALRDGLSAVLRSLEPGESLDITDRGRVVAHLVAGGPSSPYERLLASGALRLPTRPQAPPADWPPPEWVPLPTGTVRALLDEDRAEST